MTVNATLEPSTISTRPGTDASLTLRLHNDGDADEAVKLAASGTLAGGTVLQSETIYLEPGETFDVAVTVAVPATLDSGPHYPGVEVTTNDASAAVTVAATMTVESNEVYAVSMSPDRSASASSGKHEVIIDNVGNAPILADLLVEPGDSDIDVELSTPVVNVDPGRAAKVELRLRPRKRFWSGAPVEHPFRVAVTGNDQVTHSVDGVYEQGPRLKSWMVPALAGMLGSLLLGTLAWFVLIKPAVTSIADQRAEDAVATQQIEFDQKVADLEAAGDAARQLPLGTPADLRLNASATPGAGDTDSFTVAADRVLSVTDVVFQNPSGAVGRVSLIRSGEVILESDLANFRDLDMHFVAPFRFEPSDTVEIHLDCVTPGPGNESCTVSASVIGFVDTAE